MSTITIITDKMTFGGKCIGKFQEKTIFIPYAIPGEKYEVEITKEFKDYSEARIVNILEKSPYRVTPACPYYEKCGGCNMMHIQEDYQIELRKEILKDAFIREGITPPEIEVVKGNNLGYRCRFQFHDGGMMESRTNNIIPIEQCLCATEEVNHYLKEVPFDNRALGRINVLGSSKITSVPEGFDKLIIAEQPEKVVERQQKEAPRYTPNGRKLKKQKKIKKMYAGSTGNEHNYCSVQLLDKNISFDVQGFFQSNLEVLEKTIPLITQDLSGKNVLDMYAGCGTFSTFLTDKFEKVCLVEHNKSALVYAEQNLVGKKHESYGLSGEVWTKYHAENYINQNGHFDAVVIDPPRLGMEKEVCQWLQKSDIPTIRSLSCDIATHARDAKFLLRNGGYTLDKLYLLDFYPQTCHIESLAYFSK